MAANWYIARDGQQHGPLTAEEFAEFVRRGELRQTDLLWHEGATDWFPATRYLPPKGAGPIDRDHQHSVNNSPKQAEISDEEYRNVVTGARTGALLIGIDRAVARKFFMEVPLARMEAVTGEKPYVEKLVTMTLFAGTWVCLLASLPLAYLAFGWWAAAVIPVAVFVYFVFISGGSGMWVDDVPLQIGLYPSKSESWWLASDKSDRVR